MTTKEALEIYKEQRRLLRAFSYAEFIIDWDMQTEAPIGGVSTAANQQAALAEMAYNLQTEDKFVDAIEMLYVARGSLDEVLAHEVEVLKKDVDNTRKTPQKEYVEFRKLVSAGYSAYVAAKQSDNFALFLPTLKKIIAYKRKVTKWLESDTLKGYDVLLDAYEPFFLQKDYDKFFDLLREKLVPFVKKVTSLPQPQFEFAHKIYPVDKQKEFCEYLRDVMCFDKSRGVLKESEHPFTTGFGNDDVRVTVHYYPDNFVSSIFSVIHETGHALYEQQVDPSLCETFCGGGASLGMHESQSRFYENVIGRSEAFWKAHFPKLQQTFPEQLAGVTVEQFVRYVNVAQCSFVRTEADELTYPLHVMLRYEMEKKFIEGSLEAEDFPKYWNDAFTRYFGITPTKDSEGVLQDVHWAYGDVGYFPTYALGSAIAAQIYHSMQKDIDVDSALAGGTTRPLNNWLKERVHKYGASKYPKEILKLATGEEFNPDYYVDYLINKYSKIYGL